MNQLFERIRPGKLIVALLLILNIHTVLAQIDTVFWFAAPWITKGHNNNVPQCFRIATFTDTTLVRIRQPANSFDTTVKIPPRTLYSKFLNNLVDSLENKPANTVLNRAFKISSDYPITVVYDFITPVPYNPETYSLKGSNGMGTEFLTPFQTKGNNGPYSPQPYSQFVIAATENNTVVWITPKCPIVGHPANVTFSVVLNAGQSYNCQNMSSTPSVAGQNLSGSIIVSNKPITVTVADDSVGGVSGCYDLMGDQIVPTDIVGTEYIVNKGKMNAAQFEGMYVVATQNFTQLSINDGTVTTVVMNKGDTYFYKTTQALTYVVATKPVYLMHASGFGCELGEAILPPLDCAGSKLVSFARNTSTTQSFFLNILCPVSAINTFTLTNGTATLVLASSNFTAVPGTGGAWQGAQIGPISTTLVPLGSASFLSNTVADFALGVINGEPSEGCLYHYMSSFKRKSFINAGSDFTVCAGSTNTFALSGMVGGGALTGTWMPVPGSGTQQATGSFGVYTSTLGTISTTYSMTSSDSAKSSIKLMLQHKSKCDSLADTITVYIKQGAVVNVSPQAVTMCKNNLTPVALTGTVLNAPGGQNWSGGGGAYGSSGSANTSYTPSVSDATTGTVSLALNSIGGCTNTSDTVIINFTNPPTVSVPPDINVCTNNPTVAINSGTISGGTTQGVWSTNGQGFFTPSDTLMNTNYVLGGTELTAGGTVTVALTSINNGLCAAVTKTLAINIYPKPVVNAGPNDTICASAGVINLNGLATFAGAPTTPTWSAISGTGSFGSVNSATTTYVMSANDTIAGTVQFVISAQGICPNPETDTITIAIIKLPNVNAGINVVACDNANIILNGNVTGFTNSGQWSSSGTGTFVPNSTSLNPYYSPSLSDVANGSVTFTLSSTNNKGCNPVKDSVKVTFKPSPNANFVTGNTCVNDPVNFTDASSSTLAIVSQNWDFGDGSTSITNNPIHSYSLANTYTVTYVVTASNGCPDTVRKPIDINSLPVADFYFNNACQSLQTIFDDSSFVNPGIIVKWSWDFKDGTKDSTTSSPAHIYTSAGLYNVVLTVTSDKGCLGTTTKAVNVLPQPQAEFGMTNNPTLALENVYFSDFSTPSGSIANWYWNFGDSVTAVGNSPVHFFADQGMYLVTLTVVDLNGCSDTTSKTINVTLLPLVPTAFSPNKDGNNDLLTVKGGPFENMKFRVYNNWGEMVFETFDQKTGWDGTFRGLEAPMGVYVWVLEVDMHNNKSVKKSGDVTLLR